MDHIKCGNDIMDYYQIDSFYFINEELADKYAEGLEND